MEFVTLNNGVKCPVVGIGTFMLAPADAENSVREALKMGYSLVDTANAYVNERACGRGIKDSGLAREDVFLSTKLWPSEYENENAVDETLERLGVDYVDLLYIHQPAGNWLAGYRQLEKAYKEGSRYGECHAVASSEDKTFSYIPELDPATFDKHDRVNYSVEKSELTMDEEHTAIELKLTVDTHFSPVMNYFEIFMNRMILCRKAAEALGLDFKLIINEQIML